MAANGNYTVELKQTLLELKKGLEAAVEKKASVEIVNQLQRQVDAIDVKLVERSFASNTQKSLAEQLKENESLSRLLHDRKGRAVINLDAGQSEALFSRKNIITGLSSGTVNGDSLAPVGLSTSGVLPIFRIPGIVAEARQSLKIRDVLSSAPTTFDVVDFVRVATPMSIASPVPEASLKPENQLTFTSHSERIKTLATFILASRQVLSDFGELIGFLQNSLSYYVDLAEELQMLVGDGTGENLNGIVHQAAAFNTSLLPQSGATRLDVIANAVAQIDVAKEITPSFVVLHPADWWAVRLSKDSMGRYILGDPQAQVRPSLFGLDVVSTTTIGQGSFLVGSGSAAACEIRDRMETLVEISTEDSDNFRRNLITIRAEKRLAVIVKRANSFVTGSLSV